MAQLIQAENTVANVAAGGQPTARSDNAGASVISALLGYETARRSVVFNATTVASGVWPGTTISTTAAMALQNPDSGANWLVLLSVRAAYVSGTLGAGFHALISHVPGVDFSGTAITPVSSRLGSGTATGLPFYTATVPTGGTIVRPLFSSLPLVATTAVGFPIWKDDMSNDPIIIPPGYGVSIQGTVGAGTSPLMIYTMTWAELLIPA